MTTGSENHIASRAERESGIAIADRRANMKMNNFDDFTFRQAVLRGTPPSGESDDDDSTEQGGDE